MLYDWCGDADICKVFAITSHSPRTCDKGDYPIMYWEDAGLDVPSVVRLSVIIPLCKDSIIKKYGRLHLSDIFAIKDKLNTLYKR